MAIDAVAPTERGVSTLKHIDHGIEDLVNQARASDEADRRLTVREALKHYKLPVFWAMVLSTSLIMEGFDLTTVRRIACHRVVLCCN